MSTGASPTRLSLRGRRWRTDTPARSRHLGPIFAIAIAATVYPAATQAQIRADQECDPAVQKMLDDAARAGIEYEVRRKEMSMRPPASVFDLGCLNTLMSLNLNIFSGGLPTLDMLLAMGTRLLCNYAQQEFSRLTAPLNRSFSIPGIPGGLGSALGLSTINLGSLGVGGGSGGLMVNGQNYTPGGVLGDNGWLYGDPVAGDGTGTVGEPGTTTAGGTGTADGGGTTGTGTGTGTGTTGTGVGVGTTGSTGTPVNYSGNGLYGSVSSSAGNINVDPNAVMAIGQVESGLKNVPTANGSTSAAGPWQITTGTWNDFVKKYDLNYTSADRNDSTAQATVAPYIVRDYAAAITRATGEPATTLQTYSAYLFGPGGGSRIATATPDTPLSAIIPQQQLNNNNMSNWTVGQFNSTFTQRLGSVANQPVITK